LRLIGSTAPDGDIAGRGRRAVAKKVAPSHPPSQASRRPPSPLHLSPAPLDLLVFVVLSLWSILCGLDLRRRRHIAGAACGRSADRVSVSIRPAQPTCGPADSPFSKPPRFYFRHKKFYRMSALFRRSNTLFVYTFFGPQKLAAFLQLAKREK